MFYNPISHKFLKKLVGASNCEDADKPLPIEVIQQMSREADQKNSEDALSVAQLAKKLKSAKKGNINNIEGY